MTYIEELFHEAYLADIPKSQQDVLLLPKGISEECTTSLYVDRDYFLGMLRNQRGKDGMNEAILSTVLSAPEKNNFLVFYILARNANLMQIYLDKLQEYSSNNEKSVAEPRFNRELFRAMAEMESNNTTDNTSSESNNSQENYYQASKELNKEGEMPTEQALEVLEKEKSAFLMEMEKGLEKFCKLLSISPSQLSKEEQDLKVYEPTEEDILNEKKYTEEVEMVDRDMDRLVCKDALHLLFSLDDMSPSLKDDFLQGVVELMPYLKEEDQLSVMGTLTSAFMGKSTNNVDLKDAINKLSEVGIKNYKFDSIDKLHAIMIAFFYSDEEDVK